MKTPRTGRQRQHSKTNPHKAEHKRPGDGNNSQSAQNRPCRDPPLTTPSLWSTGGDRPVSQHHLPFLDGHRSLTIKLDGIDLDRDGASPVAAPLFLRFFMAEGLAFGEFQDLIGSLTPVSSCPSLVNNERLIHRRQHQSPVTSPVPSRQSESMRFQQPKPNRPSLPGPESGQHPSPWHQRNCLLLVNPPLSPLP